MNPFNLAGPEFLSLYMIVAASAFVLAAGLRWYLRLPAEEQFDSTPTLSPYEVAYLSDGEERALNAAVARLLTDGAIEIDALTPKFKPLSDTALEARPEVERAIMAAILPNAESGESIAQVRTKARHALKPIREKLEKMRLVLDERQSARARFFPLLVIAAVALFGSIKIMVGIARDRPVGSLFILCLLTLVAGLVFLRAVHRSRRGDSVLEELRHRNSAMEYGVMRHTQGIPGEDLVLALGLFGMGVVGTPPLQRFNTTLQQEQSRAKQNSSAAGASCGASSCGGGGGCGGGGCGGCGG